MIIVTMSFVYCNAGNVEIFQYSTYNNIHLLMYQTISSCVFCLCERCEEEGVVVANGDDGRVVECRNGS